MRLFVSACYAIAIIEEEKQAGKSVEERVSDIPFRRCVHTLLIIIYFPKG